MRVICCPGLRVIRSDSNITMVEHPVTGACYSLDPPIASLLKLLREPEDIGALCDDEGPIPRAAVDYLLSLGLLVDADNPYAKFKDLLRRCQPTFLGCPEGDAGSAQVCIIGMPADGLSDTGAGAAAGPAALRLAASFPRYQANIDTGRPTGWYDYHSARHVMEGVTYADLGDVPLHKGEPPTEAGARLKDVVHVCHLMGSFPLVLGGDHSLSAWAIAGIPEEAITVLHLDAHSDLGTGASDLVPTNGSVAKALLEQERVQALLTVGVRGFLPLEQPSFRSGHRIVSVAEARSLGAEAIVALLPEDVPCYVTFDIDVLDPSVAPATNAPVPGGLFFEEVRAIMEAVGRKRRVIAADVVELNPDRDPHLLTARTAVHLTMSLMGACLGEKEGSS